MSQSIAYVVGLQAEIFPASGPLMSFIDENLLAARKNNNTDSSDALAVKLPLEASFHLYLQGWISHYCFEDCECGDATQGVKWDISKSDKGIASGQGRDILVDKATHCEGQTAEERRSDIQTSKTPKLESSSDTLSNSHKATWRTTSVNSDGCGGAATAFSQQSSLHLPSASNIIDTFRMLGSVDPQFPRRFITFEYFHRKNFIVKCGAAFGASFLLYEDHPDKVHGRFIVIIADIWTRWRDIVSTSRLAESVCKDLVVVLFTTDPALTRFDDEFHRSQSEMSPLEVVNYIMSTAVMVVKVYQRFIPKLNVTKANIENSIYMKERKTKKRQIEDNSGNNDIKDKIGNCHDGACNGDGDDKDY